MIIKFVKRILVMFILFSSMAACGGTDKAQWTEEVRSWDGSVFQLEGRGGIGSNGWPTAHRGKIRYVEYYHRPTQAYWRSSGGYRPIIFDLVNGVPYVVILIDNDMQCYLLNYPEEGLLIYKWNKTIGWQSVKPTELSLKFEFNLMEQMFDTRNKKDDVKGFVSLRTKAIREGGDRVGDFAKWKAEYGSTCEKVKIQVMKGRKLSTDEKVPSFEGFHGNPNF